MQPSATARTDPAEDTIEAMALFGRVLEQVDDSHLELETPCPEWNVEALISHVVLGDASVPMLFDGRPLPEGVTIDPSLLGPNPMATWRGTALAAIEALRQPGAMEKLVDHPVGRRPGSAVARFRLVDLLGHTWDLATAIGVELQLPEHLAEAALDFLFPMVDQLRQSTFFGPAIEPPADADAATRLLALIGRSAWSAER
ncbi:MAG: TIGR03086 family protein [Acidimicrobiia bacterium]|nr:TIGR03086 family protein [Acidimicrobiia bacterium]